MKHAVTMILSLALTGTVLTGCGESRQSHQDILQQESSISIHQDAVVDAAETEVAETETAETETAQTETAEKITQTAREYKDNFEVDSKAAKEFAEKVKAAAASKDLDALADLTAFPVYVNLPDAGVVATREDFLKLGAETVFTEELLKSVEMADIEDFQPSMAGFSISDGGTANIIFGVVDGVLAISGINY